MAGRRGTPGRVVVSLKLGASWFLWSLGALLARLPWVWYWAYNKLMLASCDLQGNLKGGPWADPDPINTERQNDVV